MKRIAVIIILLACWMGQTDAQIKFGLKGGLNFNKFDYSKGTGNLDNSTGWHAGALLQFKIPIIGIGVQPELLYTVKKAKVDGNSNSVNYFEVPLNIRWAFNLIVVRPFIMGGPYFSYATDFSGKIFKDSIRRFDWGIGLGGGIELWKLQLALRYSWGLQDVSDADDFKLKNNVFSLSLGFLF